jgi:hypothetical protein
VKQIDRSIAFAILVSISAGVFVALVPGRTSLIGHVWLVAVLGIALVAALSTLLRAVPRRPSAFDSAFAPGRKTRARPASLERLEREVVLATGTAFDVHYRLRPALRTIASGLLLRRGVDLERTPDRAEALLGPTVWELVRPDRPAPDDRTAAGIPLETVSQAVADLERIAWS